MNAKRISHNTIFGQVVNVVEHNPTKIKQHKHRQYLIIQEYSNGTVHLQIISNNIRLSTWESYGPIIEDHSQDQLT